MEVIVVSGLIPTNPERVYAGWLQSEEHTSFTGAAKAVIEPTVGSAYSVHDGYVSGKILELKKNKKIVVTWRAKDFPSDAPDAKVEITLSRREEGDTAINVVQEGVPPELVAKLQGWWIDSYITPMRIYFGQLAEAEKRAAKRLAEREAKRQDAAAAPEARKPEPAKRQEAGTGPGKAKKSKATKADEGAAKRGPLEAAADQMLEATRKLAAKHRSPAPAARPTAPDEEVQRLARREEVASDTAAKVAAKKLEGKKSPAAKAKVVAEKVTATKKVTAAKKVAEKKAAQPAGSTKASTTKPTSTKGAGTKAATKKKAAAKKPATKATRRKSKR